MLQRVDIGPRSLNAYRGIVEDNILDDLLEFSRDLKGARVAHINATPYGGGVSELLRSAVPILNDIGLNADWKTIAGDSFYNARTVPLGFSEYLSLWRHARRGRPSRSWRRR